MSVEQLTPHRLLKSIYFSHLKSLKGGASSPPFHSQRFPPVLSPSVNPLELFHRSWPLPLLTNPLLTNQLRTRGKRCIPALIPLPAKPGILKVFQDFSRLFPELLAEFLKFLDFSCFSERRLEIRFEKKVVRVFPCLSLFRNDLILFPFCFVGDVFWA